MLLEKRKEGSKCNGSAFIESNASLIKTLEKEVDSYCTNFAKDNNEIILCLKCYLVRMIEGNRFNQKEKKIIVAIAGMMSREMSYEHSISSSSKIIGVSKFLIKHNVGIIFEESVGWISRELEITQEEAKRSLLKMMDKFLRIF